MNFAVAVAVPGKRTARQQGRQQGTGQAGAGPQGPTHNKECDHV